jgi:hypothetical protein
MRTPHHARFVGVSRAVVHVMGSSQAVGRARQCVPSIAFRFGQACKQRPCGKEQWLLDSRWIATGQVVWRSWRVWGISPDHQGSEGLVFEFLRAREMRVRPTCAQPHGAA